MVHGASIPPVTKCGNAVAGIKTVHPYTASLATSPPQIDKLQALQISTRSTLNMQHAMPRVVAQTLMQQLAATCCHALA